MSYNIKGHGALLKPVHIDEIAAMIVAAKPDIAGIQEVHRRTWQSRFRDQAAELERLTGMQLVFGRAVGGERREYGNAILTRGEIAEWHVEPLPGSGEPRTILSVTLQINGAPLVAYVTHLSAWGRLGIKNRLAQAEAVAERVSRSTLPFVLTGDFNSAPHSEELRVFRSGLLAMSCFADPVITYRATRQCLDYIFVDPGWRIRNAEVVKGGPSDHWPLVADLERAVNGRA